MSGFWGNSPAIATHQFPEPVAGDGPAMLNPPTSWCLSCGQTATLIPGGQGGIWQCVSGHRFTFTRRCPTCGHLGQPDRDGVYLCTGRAGHRFWAADHYCVCGAVPVLPSERDVWVCEGCDRWEVAS